MQPISCPKALVERLSCKAWLKPKKIVGTSKIA